MELMTFDATTARASEAVVERRSEHAGPDLTSRAYWTGTIKMSLSKLFILAALAEGPKHGYAIAQRVAAMTKGCCSPSEGTIYPSLRDFESGGYVTAEETTVGGRRRKVYTMTDRGLRAHRVAVEAWLEVAWALGGVGRALHDSLDAPVGTTACTSSPCT